MSDRRLVDVDELLAWLSRLRQHHIERGNAGRAAGVASVIEKVRREIARGQAGELMRDLRSGRPRD